MGQEFGPTYSDVADHMAYMRKTWNRSTMFEWQPDFVRKGEQTFVRWNIVARCWVIGNALAPQMSGRAWFGGESGFRTAPAAMSAALTAVERALEEEEALAKRQARF